MTGSQTNGPSSWVHSLNKHINNENLPFHQLRKNKQLNEKNCLENCIMMASSISIRSCLLRTL